MPPRFTRADSRVDAVRGCLVVERGPEVFALESVDLAGTPLEASDFADLRVDSAVPPGNSPTAAWSWRSSTSAPGRDPTCYSWRYHEWAERGPSRMRVWVPVVGS